MLKPYVMRGKRYYCIAHDFSVDVFLIHVIMSTDARSNALFVS
jgi:hypothetical protein